MKGWLSNQKHDLKVSVRSGTVQDSYGGIGNNPTCFLPFHTRFLLLILSLQHSQNPLVVGDIVEWMRRVFEFTSPMNPDDPPANSVFGTSD